ncbi:MAG: hypothetical protein HKL86_05885 [Acidimicrobiaceae bacterium]|nr:hypothetical protein [Acidimicrobiaceae bacterium]
MSNHTHSMMAERVLVVHWLQNSSGVVDRLGAKMAKRAVLTNHRSFSSQFRKFLIGM